jgi:ABC-type sugar transport system ATPase subunit
MMKMLAIQNLNVQLGRFSLKDINLKLDEGEYFVLLGPSGAGKTALLETLAGRYKPSCGDVCFNGKSLLPLLPEERKIGFVYQNYELFPHMTVEENIIFGLKIRNHKREEIKQKRGDLTGIYGFDVNYNGINYEVYYTISEVDGKKIVVLLAGTRENSYEQLKRYIK